LYPAAQREDVLVLLPLFFFSPFLFVIPAGNLRLLRPTLVRLFDFLYNHRTPVQ
jgi:hypothetical protein